MGGKAFEDITRRIHKNEIEHTLWWLESRWPDYSRNGLNRALRDCMLGSAGKNETSGDIDLNLEITRYDQDKVAEQLKAILGPEYVKPRPGNNQIFTAVPIEGDPTKGYVQIDFMFGDYEWQKFSYHGTQVVTDGSANGWMTSAYKGLYRTELLKALTAFHSDWVLEEDGEMVARVGPTFFHDRGIVWRYRYRPMRKDGTARVKALEEVTEQEFMLLFPSAQKARATVIKKPIEVIQMLLGERYDISSADSFERLWTYVSWSYSKEDRQLIAKIYIERLNSLKADIPKSLAKTLGVPECAGQKS